MISKFLCFYFHGTLGTWKLLELTGFYFSLVLTVFFKKKKKKGGFACTCSFEERDLCPKFGHFSLWLRVYPIGKESYSI